MADPYSFDDVLASAERLQRIVPDAVLVGGTAAAIYAAHRVSLDHDHVLTDLRTRFDAVLEALEATDGWVTARVRSPVLILGSLDGVETGIRQLIRRRPLEVVEATVDGHDIRVPTIAEAARVKAWLVLRRNATRDYVDLVALAETMTQAAAAEVLAGIDAYYADQIGPDGTRVATQLARQLAEPAPFDLDQFDLKEYRHLAPRWQDWASVSAACEALAADIFERAGDDG